MLFPSDLAQLTGGQHGIQALREQWKRRLPGVLQPFLTWLSGYPYRGQQPLFPGKPWWVMVLMPVLLVAGGVLAGFVIVEHGGWTWLGLPFAWMAVVSGARTLQVQTFHQAVHGVLSGKAWLDRAITETLSTMICSQDFTAYRTDHAEIHHPTLASDEDPDKQFVIEVLKIEPGQTVEENRRLFWAALCSPRIHLVFLLGRLKANFVTAPPIRRLMSVVWWASVAATVLAHGMLWPLFLSFLLPQSLGYQASAVSQFLTEHLWFQMQLPGQTARQHHQSLLVNRHLGDWLPSPELQGLEWIREWLRWWTRLLTYHLFIRTTVLVGDLPVHGTHHLVPKDRGWTSAIFRSRELLAKAEGVPLQLIGSFGDMLAKVFESFAASPRLRPSESAMNFQATLAVATGM
jgi:hypothetical protein